MKIIAAVRTMNEEENIARFCRSYLWADKVIVADGGSSDETVKIAKKFPNVSVREYPVYVEMSSGHRRNPHGSHINFLIDWAFLEEKADWVIFDDCDCFPNTHVKAGMRDIMESTDKKYIYVTRLYLWKNEGHFPSLAKPSGDWTPSLYAWKNGTKLRFRADRVSREETHQELTFNPPESEKLNLMPPYALAHCPWQNDKMIEKKLNFYRESGQIPNMKHPTEFGGKIEPLPEWAIVEDR